MFSDGDVCRLQVDPGPSVVVLDSIARGEIRLMRVTTEDLVGAAELGVVQRTGSDLAAKAKPARVESIDAAGERFRRSLDSLDLTVNLNPNAADEKVAATEAIELVSVNGDVPLALKAPDVALVNRNADQVRHDVREATVVIALDPDDLDLSLGVRQLANTGKKLPMVAGQAAEIQVREDIAEQDQPAVPQRTQKLQRIPGAAHLRAKMNIGHDDGIKSLFRHAPIFVHTRYRVMNIKSKHG